jgi:protocatechuate 3,4-dioxygenase, alpha subunit
VIATPSQTVGPFFSFGLTANQMLGHVASPDAAGEHIVFRVRIVDGGGAPVPDAMVELWQADRTGSYGSTSADFRGFGRLGTDANGSCAFETIRPGAVAAGDGSTHASHINLCVFMRGLLRHIYTRAYFAGDPLDQDAVLTKVPEERRGTLIARPTAGSRSDWLFEIRLQGEHETVFFDL